MYLNFEICLSFWLAQRKIWCRISLSKTSQVGTYRWYCYTVTDASVNTTAILLLMLLLILLLYYTSYTYYCYYLLLILHGAIKNSLYSSGTFIACRLLERYRVGGLRFHLCLQGEMFLILKELYSPFLFIF